MKNRIVVFTILLCTGCASGKWVLNNPLYNIQAVQLAQYGSDKTDTVFARIIRSTDKHYITYSSEFLDINATVSSLRILDSIRPSASKFYLLSDKLKQRLLEDEEEYRLKDVINNTNASTMDAEIHALWKAYLLAEESLTH